MDLFSFWDNGRTHKKRQKGAVIFDILMLKCYMPSCFWSHTELMCFTEACRLENRYLCCSINRRLNSVLKT